MDAILLAESDADILEKKMLDKVKRILSYYRLQIAPKKYKEEILSII